MSIRRNPLKILTAFIATLIATVFGVSLTKSITKTKESQIPSMEERLSTVRELFKNKEMEASNQSDTFSAVQQRLDVEDAQVRDVENEQIKQWSDWSNGWSDWDNL